MIKKKAASRTRLLFVCKYKIYQIIHGSLSRRNLISLQKAKIRHYFHFQPYLTQKKYVILTRCHTFWQLFPLGIRFVIRLADCESSLKELIYIDNKKNKKIQLWERLLEST